MHDAVTLHMAAPPERVWQLLSDVTNVGRFSPETFEAEWLDGATEPAVGVQFRGHVRRNGRGPVYWTKCRIVATWRYELQPNGDGTDVTESFELADTAMNRIYWKLAGRARGRTNRNGMRTTLERVKDVVEAPDPTATD